MQHAPSRHSSKSKTSRPATDPPRRPTATTDVEPGRIDSWESLITHYGRYLRLQIRCTLCRFGERPLADRVEELSQEAYCRLFKSQGHDLSRFNSWSEPERLTYLGRVAQTAVYDALRSERAEKRGKDLTHPLSPDSEASLEDLGSAMEISNEDKIMARLCLLQLMKRMQQRADANRRAQRRRLRRNLAMLFLTVVEGWTCRELAGALPGPATAKNVETMMYRIRQQLRSSWGEMAALCEIR